jgi:Arc/MetJ family transcription regulator
MKRRTTIEIDDDLLARARRALGSKTTRETVEEALRRAADMAEGEQIDRAARQRGYLERLSSRIDVTVLASEEMWR